MPITTQTLTLDYKGINGKERRGDLFLCYCYAFMDITTPNPSSPPFIREEEIEGLKEEEKKVAEIPEEVEEGEGEGDGEMVSVNSLLRECASVSLSEVMENNIMNNDDAVAFGDSDDELRKRYIHSL